MLRHYSQVHAKVLQTLVGLFLFAALQATAVAGFITFTDRTAFLNAAAGASLLTFNEDFASDPGDPFTITGGSDSVTLDITLGAWSSTGGGRLGIGSAATSLVSTNVTGTVVGIGFNYESSLSAPGTFAELELNTQSVTATASSTTLSSQAGFLGLLSTDGMTISSIDLIRANTNTFNVSVVDDIVIVTGTPSAGVPEPASWLLFALSGLGLAGLRARRRAG